MTWTLQSDCTATRTIEIPWGISLEGNNCRITLAGNPEHFHSVGLRIDGGDLRNLTVDGSGLEPFCPHSLAAVVVGGPAVVEQTSVTSLRIGASCSSVVGIEIDVFEGDAVDLIDVSVTDIDGTGMLLTGDGTVSLAGCSVKSATPGLQAVNSVAVLISDSTFESAGIGIRASDDAQATIDHGDQAWVTTNVGVTDRGIANIGNFTLAGFGAASSAVSVPAAAVAERAGAAHRHLHLVSLEA